MVKYKTKIKMLTYIYTAKIYENTKCIKTQKAQVYTPPFHLPLMDRVLYIHLCFLDKRFFSICVFVEASVLFTSHYYVC